MGIRLRRGTGYSKIYVVHFRFKLRGKMHRHQIHAESQETAVDRVRHFYNSEGYKIRIVSVFRSK